ncbi:MAG: YccF domain-containing protein [Chloroflexi bacterium]|nr:YccF domain-containing protein [Chloroflexota bacterium]
MSGNTSTVQAHKGAHVPFWLRVLWFIFIGWHVTLYWILVAWALNVTIVGLPLGLWMLNRVPLVLTLKPVGIYTVSDIENGKVVSVRYEGVRQHFWPGRLLYFLVIGWWFSLLWSLAAWALCASIIGLPFGVWMLNRMPAVTTLHRGETRR